MKISVAKYLLMKGVVATIVACWLTSIAYAGKPESQASSNAQQVLFTGVNVFDGTSDELISNVDVLVEANIIKTIGSDLDVSAGATVIDGAERTLMPGLIDNHVHLMLPGPTLPAMEANSTWEDIAIHGVAQDVSDAGHHDGT